MEGHSSCRDGGVVAIIYRWLGQMRGLGLDPGPHIYPPICRPRVRGADATARARMRAPVSGGWETKHLVGLLD